MHDSAIRPMNRPAGPMRVRAAPHVPPQVADGHPRVAVHLRASFNYDFTVEDLAGAYWYHPHTHMHTSEQAYMGLAGFIIVNDAEEDAVGLPSGPHEIACLLQDGRVDVKRVPYYAPSGWTC